MALAQDGFLEMVGHDSCNCVHWTSAASQASSLVIVAS